MSYKIDEVKLKCIDAIREIKSKHYDDKVWKQSAINVLNNHLKELIELDNKK